MHTHTHTQTHTHTHTHNTHTHILAGQHTKCYTPLIMNICTHVVPLPMSAPNQADRNKLNLNRIHCIQGVMYTCAYINMYTYIHTYYTYALTILKP